MNPEQKAFLDHIASQPWGDEVSRHVYADWLEEHDMIEEAKRQRKYVPAERWLREFAEGADGASYEEIIEAGRKAYENPNVSTMVGNSLGFGASNKMYEDSFREAFWDNWSVVTGLEVSEDTRKGAEVFSCCY